MTAAAAGTVLAHPLPHTPGEWLVLLGGLLLGALLVLLTGRRDDEEDEELDEELDGDR